MPDLRNLPKCLGVRRFFIILVRCLPVRCLPGIALAMLGHRIALAQAPTRSTQNSADPILQAKQVVLEAQHQTLAEMVKVLSKQIGRGIVVDGIPILKQADFRMEGSAKEALDKVADTYDFTWSLSKNGVILMRKRFHHQDEYPQMNLPELREATRDVVAILHALPYDPDSGHVRVTLSQLYRTLTPEQVARLRAKGLSVEDLSPPQINLLQSAILTNAFANTCNGWERLQQYLELLPKGFFQARIWPFYYQQKMGMPVAKRPDAPTSLEFDFFEPGWTKSLPGDLPTFEGEMKIPYSFKRLP